MHQCPQAWQILPDLFSLFDVFIIYSSWHFSKDKTHVICCYFYTPSQGISFSFFSFLFLLSFFHSFFLFFLSPPLTLQLLRWGETKNGVTQSSANTATNWRPTFRLSISSRRSLWNHRHTLLITRCPCVDKASRRTGGQRPPSQVRLSRQVISSESRAWTETEPPSSCVCGMCICGLISWDNG